MPIARLTTKGRLTIPVAVRKRYGFDAGDNVELVLDEKGIRLFPLKRRKLMDLYGILPVKGPSLKHR